MRTERFAGWKRITAQTARTILLLACGVASAQTADEHAAHHPAQDQSTATSGPASGNSSAGGMSMGRMMGGCSGQGCERGMMGTPAERLLYPQLMALPDLPPERRADIERQAHSRMIDGIRDMTSAVSDVSGAVERQDFAVMQSAAERMSAALGQFDSGLAAHRALAEGQAPRNIALRWFKRELNLADPAAAAPAHGIFGLSSFHYFTMALFTAFAAMATWMYVARSRRTSAVLASLRTSAATPSSSSPVPSAAVPMPQQPEAVLSDRVQAPAPVSTTGSWAGKLRVARIFQETPTVKTFRLAPVEGIGSLPFLFEPGQFLTLSVPSAGTQVRRSYSIASSPCCHGWCELTVKHESSGIVSGYLHERVKEGDLLDASGPYGRFTFRGVEATNVVFIGGGVGITPLMSSIRYLTDQSWNGRIDLLYACARLEGVIFREELEQLARRHPNLHVSIVLSNEPSQTWTGLRGFVTSELLNGIPDIRSRRIHLCGPPVMMDAVRNELGKLGIGPDAIHSELFLSPPRPATSSPETLASEATAAVTCSFARSKQEAPLAAGQTVLEAAEGVGVAIEYACRQGFCGVCKVKLLSGEVTMEIDDGLTPADRSSGLILACQAKATADITVDA